MSNKMSVKMSANARCLGLVAALLFTGAASAVEVPATPDARNCKADYPRAALQNDEEGTVSMSFLVSSGGEVKDAKINRSSGYKTLDKAAVKRLTACKFTPGTKDGAPADTWTRVDYAWQLE
jgi:protein TonB